MAVVGASRREQLCIADLELLIDKGGPEPDEYQGVHELLHRAHHGVGGFDPVRLRTIAMPTLQADTMQGFAFRKPRGYAGDFEIIERIYGEHVCVDERFARWDRFFHAQPASRAVRNRKGYYKQLLTELANTKPRATVLEIGAGSARSIFEWLEDNPHSEVRFECVELDGNAIAFAKSLTALYADRITFHQANALRFRSPDSFDLVWSAGLLDYFEDRTFVRLLTRLMKLVGSGGELVVGNFSTGNPSRLYMEMIGEWYLNHRTPAELLQLGVAAGGRSDSIRVASEPEQVNLFLHIEPPD